ncbi:MAG TPA: hypothetical protein VF756_14340 [Thermoanaerobaculia bacterium]
MDNATPTLVDVALTAVNVTMTMVNVALSMAIATSSPDEVSWIATILFFVAALSQDRPRSFPYLSLLSRWRITVPLFCAPDNEYF